ncbi:MAG: RNA-binding S4 domain-containing protein [Bacteroidetes bacterium]|nr:MAG: RNA-binding S4 domain-containing protein [Bacteroidota bacterium]
MGVRIDKWLWSVRIYKTRTLATQACKSGHISIDGNSVKASREIKIGDIIVLRKDHLNMQLKVKELAEKRMGAKLVSDFMEDLTPQEEYDRLKAINSGGFEQRERGVGRPTKRNRRDITSFKDL